MKMFSESDLDSLEFRQQVIKEIEGPENLRRKRDALKRYEIYKDQVKKWVVESLERDGFAPQTISQMMSRAANVSLLRKVVNKLARSYSQGVHREVVENAEDTQKINALARHLAFDDVMRKTDRYRELYKNCLVQIVPEQTNDPDAEDPEFDLKMRALSPWQYDVIEDARDREKMRVVVLSDYDDTQPEAATEERARLHPEGPSTGVGIQTNAKDDLIADLDRAQTKKYVFWSKNRHFVTDQDGNIKQMADNPEGLNPIERLPFVNVAEDQDGEFWARGGDDLIDGAILANKLMTDMFFVAFLQGFGQPIAIGKNLPAEFKMGPNNVLCFEYDPARDDPRPEFSFVQTNVDISGWMSMVEQYVALLLTTNSLSPSNIATKLDANSFPSGIALMIEQAEATNDVVDKQRFYLDIERQLWDITRRWQENLIEGDVAIEKLNNIGLLSDEMSLSISFPDFKPVRTEREKLEAIKMRKELGINSMVELLMIDNTDLTREEAEEKLLNIRQDEIERASVALAQNVEARPQLEADDGR